jgi:hypothetical protein
MPPIATGKKTFRHFSLVPTADFAVIEGGCYFGIRAGGTVVLFAAFARQACRRMIPPARRFVLAGDPDLLPACRAVRRVSPRGTFLLPLPGIRSKTTPIAAIRIERFP